jgi:uncharacterized heparinase superfamily protein
LLAEDPVARRSWHHGTLKRWMAENPPPRGTGWEPYPTSRRLVNWIGWALAGNDLPAGGEASLVTQARALLGRLEWHLRGNHLFANAKALIFAGAFFSGSEAENWLGHGLRLLDGEIAEEILADGGHFELSPMYHAIILEDMLDLIQLARLYPGALAESANRQGWQPKTESMLAWLAAMRHPDGDIGLFNDAAFDQARAPAALFAYAERLGLAVRQPAAGLTHLAESGFVRLDRDPWFALFDVGEVGASYIPGHAHADTLSFELSFRGHRLISNSGTSVYEAGALRDAERATAAHATVEIDGQNSSETWAGFRVGRRAHPFGVETGPSPDGIRAAASHDGYRYIGGRPTHRRQLLLSADGLTVSDHVTGDGRHEAAGRLPLHPDSVAHRMPAGWRVQTPAGAVDITVEGPVALDIEPGAFAPAFGVRQDRPVLAWRYAGALPLNVATTFRSAADA